MNLKIKIPNIRHNNINICSWNSNFLENIDVRKEENKLVSGFCEKKEIKGIIMPKPRISKTDPANIKKIIKKTSSLVNPVIRKNIFLITIN